jgi:hypothetical protein
MMATVLHEPFTSAIEYIEFGKIQFSDYNFTSVTYEIFAQYTEVSSTRALCGTDGDHRYIVYTR